MEVILVTILVLGFLGVVAWGLYLDHQEELAKIEKGVYPYGEEGKENDD